MARGKKKEQLSLEEKLEQALVPAGEQPYQVPGNWCWVKNQFVCYLDDGEKVDGIEYPYLEVKYLRGMKEAEIKNKGKYIKTGTKVILVDGENSGEVFEVKECGYMGSTFKVLNINQMLCDKYLIYFFTSKKDLLRNSKTGSAIPHLNKKLFFDLNLPVPPLTEQQRIVDRIERMFAQLDEAKEKITEVKESYLARKAAILSQAFTGKLTTAWRHKNNVENNWALKTFGEVAVIKSNLVKPNEYRDFPHIAPDNIEKRTGMLLQYNTIAEDGVTSGKHRFYPGQILYSKIRPYLSKVVMVDFDGLCSADMYPIEAKENTRYLWYYMLSDDFLNQASSAGSRSVLPKINQKELSKLVIAMPGIEEQKEVVKILDRLLPYEQHVLEYVEDVLEKIDLLKKSILSKAFRGQLGTNHPEEESAMELLKSILMEP